MMTIIHCYTHLLRAGTAVSIRCTAGGRGEPGAGGVMSEGSGAITIGPRAGGVSKEGSGAIKIGGLPVGGVKRAGSGLITIGDGAPEVERFCVINI